MRTGLTRIMAVFCVLAGCALAAACSKTPPEEAILANIDSMQDAVEEKKSGKAVEFISEEFVGNRGLDKRGLRRIMLGSFLRHQHVGVTITNMDIEVNPQDPFIATMECVVVLTGAKNILPQDGRIYKVTGEWRLQDDEWMLIRANWE